jgi:heme-degrading monooxygenase HmoA
MFGPTFKEKEEEERMIRPSALAMLLVALLGAGTLSATSPRLRPASPQEGGAQVAPKAVVAREWKGRVRSPGAEEYYAYLREGVKKLRATRGNLGVQIMRRREGEAVEFTVISYWESREAIKAYAGEDIEKPRHLPKDREYLIELPKRVLHYDVDYSDWGVNRGS